MGFHANQIGRFLNTSASLFPQIIKILYMKLLPDTHGHTLTLCKKMTLKG